MVNTTGYSDVEGGINRENRMLRCNAVHDRVSTQEAPEGRHAFDHVWSCLVSGTEWQPNE